jgi:hypothetical protein
MRQYCYHHHLHINHFRFLHHQDTPPQKKKKKIAIFIFHVIGIHCYRHNYNWLRCLDSFPIIISILLGMITVIILRSIIPTIGNSSSIGINIIMAELLSHILSLRVITMTLKASEASLFNDKQQQQSRCRRMEAKA